MWDYRISNELDSDSSSNDESNLSEELSINSSPSSPNEPTVQQCEAERRAGERSTHTTAIDDKIHHPAVRRILRGRLSGDYRHVNNLALSKPAIHLPFHDIREAFFYYPYVYATQMVKQASEHQHPITVAQDKTQRSNVSNNLETQTLTIVTYTPMSNFKGPIDRPNRRLIKADNSTWIVDPDDSSPVYEVYQKLIDLPNRDHDGPHQCWHTIGGLSHLDINNDHRQAMIDAQPTTEYPGGLVMGFETSDQMDR